MHDFDINPQGCIDLVSLAKQVDIANLQQRGFCIGERHGLNFDSLARLYLGKRLAKEDGVRKSDWSLTLCEEQLECGHVPRPSGTGVVLQLTPFFTQMQPTTLTADLHCSRNYSVLRNIREFRLIMTLSLRRVPRTRFKGEPCMTERLRAQLLPDRARRTMATCHHKGDGGTPLRGSYFYYHQHFTPCTRTTKLCSFAFMNAF